MVSEEVERSVADRGNGQCHCKQRQWRGEYSRELRELGMNYDVVVA